MHITCEKCQAVYSIADKVIGKAGRKVKCARCAHVWFVTNNAPEETIINLSSLSCEPAGARAQSSLPRVFVIIPILLMIAIIGLGLSSFPKFFSQITPIKNLYEKYGVYYDTNGVILSEAKYKMLDGDLVISGKFVNHSNENKYIPNLRYILLDQDKHVIFNALEKSSNRQIKPNEAEEFNARITNFSDKAAYLQLDAANKFELSLAH